MIVLAVARGTFKAIVCGHLPGRRGYGDCENLNKCLISSHEGSVLYSDVQKRSGRGDKNLENRNIGGH